jgi:hypothetical protein
VARFDALFAAARPDDGFAAADDATLAALATAAADLNFYFLTDRVDAHRALFEALSKRGPITDVQVADLHRTLVGARRWDEARALAALHPDVDGLPPVPTRVIDEGARDRMVWAIEDGGRTFRAQDVDLSEGAVLLVISHPQCGFSNRALRAIEHEEALEAALPARRVVVAPPFGDPGAAAIARWNQDHPRHRHVLANHPDAWRDLLSRWNTPQFLFLLDGEIVETVEGWPSEGRREALHAAAERLQRHSSPPQREPTAPSPR